MQNDKKIGFTQVIRLWLNSVSLDFKRTTCDRYKCVTNELSKYFYEKEIVQINNEVLNCFLREKEVNGWHYATLILAIGVIRKIIYFSIEQGFIHSLNFKPVKFKKKYRKVDSLTVSESKKINRMICNAKTGGDLAILIALNTGLRVGEICALKWKDIDFTRKRIIVSSTVHRVNCTDEKTKTKLVIQKPKTESSEREVPINSFLFEILFKHSSNNKFFVLTQSESIPDPRSVQRNFTFFCQKVFGKALGFHCLRHTFATLLISQGVDVKTVSEILGHCSVTTTLNIYRNVSFDDKAQGVRTLERLIAPKS